MSWFNKTRQRITISSEVQGTLEALVSEIRARKLKDAKVSSVSHVDDQWQCSINCKLAEAIYYQEILPLLYDSAETQSCNAVLEFEDESELVRECPTELLVSFDLSSRHAFGNKAENEFIQKMHRDILQSPQGKPAAVAYYIVSGGAVTMCVPCADPEAMERTMRSKLNAHKIEKFIINIIPRERA